MSDDLQRRDWRDPRVKPGEYEPKIESLFATVGAFDDFSDEDWINLAMAAIDQSGACVRTQRRVREALDSDPSPIATSDTCSLCGTVGAHMCGTVRDIGERISADTERF